MVVVDVGTSSQLNEPGQQSCLLVLQPQLLFSLVAFLLLKVLQEMVKKTITLHCDPSYLNVFACTLQQSQSGELVRQWHMLSQHFQAVTKLSAPVRKVKVIYGTCYYNISKCEQNPINDKSAKPALHGMGVLGKPPIYN